jgi:radical SAM-linked protein
LFRAFFFPVSAEARPRFCTIHSVDHYAEDVSMRTSHPPVPAEALARQASLRSALQGMVDAGNSREPACIKSLQAMFADQASPDLDAIMDAILADDLIEEVAEILRVSRREASDRALVETLASRLAPLAVKAQQRRSARWQLDTRRTRIRFSYAKEAGALGFDDGDIHAIFLQAFRLEGLPLALDLGKRPRPLLSVGLPLPVGAGSLAESMDAVLKREPQELPLALMARLNHRLPSGLRVHQWNVLPLHASEVGDLAQSSRWRWEVPPEQRSHAEAKVAAFLERDVWPWHRGASKAEAPLDLRTLVSEMRWEEGALCFATRMGAFQAINPLKMLGAILELAPARIVGIVRTGLDMKPDARLSQAERFVPKLKNMYEDAVLLGGGSNIILVDDDDDEPIRLG